MTNKPYSIARTASWLGLATTGSRILGFVRDSLNASLFGATAISDAYFAAFRFPNLFRDLFAEGALTMAFIPVFSKVRETEGDAAAWRLAAMVLQALVLVLCLLILIAECYT